VSAEVDADIGDIMEASDSIFAFSGRLEVAHDRIGGFIDGMYSDVGVDDATGPIGLGDVEVSLEISAIDFGLMYRAAQWNHPASARDGALDVYAGGRWFSGTVGLSPALVPSQSGDRSWVDPIIGVKIRQPLSEHFHVAAWGDIGGFGVESDLTWSATVVLGWDFEMFNLASTLYGGYRAIGWDYSDDSPTFVWDVVLHGPTLGLRISF
jgi:hypothetical protein